MKSSTAAPNRDSGAFSKQVSEMFDRVAPRYDMLNSLMSAGLHRTWRKRAADAANLRLGGTALDVCCGTGDLTIELANRVGLEGTVIGCDFSPEMLMRARAKVRGLGLSNVEFDSADALKLPYPDESFEAVTVGFGLRNLADHPAGVAEMARVARCGGRVVVLEFTRPRRVPFSAFYDLWFDRLVPFLGRFSFDATAYGYLPASVRDFPGPRSVAAMLASAGLTQIRYKILAAGIVTIHTGVKP